MRNIDIKSRKVMKWMTWTAVSLLVIVISNSASNDVTISFSHNVLNVFGFVAIAMLLVGLGIAMHARSKSYIVFICLIGLVSAMQFHDFLPAVQMYSLVAVGMIALFRWLYPEFVKHRDEQPMATVTPIRDREYGGGFL